MRGELVEEGGGLTPAGARVDRVYADALFIAGISTVSVEFMDEQYSLSKSGVLRLLRAEVARRAGATVAKKTGNKGVAKKARRK